MTGCVLAQSNNYALINRIYLANRALAEHSKRNHTPPRRTLRAVAGASLSNRSRKSRSSISTASACVYIRCKIFPVPASRSVILHRINGQITGGGGGGVVMERNTVADFLAIVFLRRFNGGRRRRAARLFVKRLYGGAGISLWHF